MRKFRVMLLKPPQQDMMPRPQLCPATGVHGTPAAASIISRTLPVLPGGWRNISNAGSLTGAQTTCLKEIASSCRMLTPEMPSEQPNARLKTKSVEQPPAAKLLYFHHLQALVSAAFPAQRWVCWLQDQALLLQAHSTLQQKHGIFK